MQFTFAFPPWLRAAVVTMACLVGTGTASADQDITIGNPSFENPLWNPTSAPDEEFYGSAAKWKPLLDSQGEEVGVTGTAHLSSTYLDPLVVGQEVGFAGDNGFTTPFQTGASSMYQVLSDLVSPGANYRLTLAVGTQPLTNVDSHYSVELWAGTSLLKEIHGTIAGGTGFQQVTLDTVGAGAGKLKIVLSETNGGQTLFDNVRLSIVPEPSTLAMSGTALLFGLGYARRRVRKMATAL
ncbi:PEP-CTERM sorting domain-containing protein [Singulisphaera sp. Ch08]|uniref:PEP-CTERM sorting domain-containing protein n=1 Tax=Singulisphaera sp. Ch08 TaxID=3120278 RepID=A0AAU7CE05_9BACT